MSVPGVLGQLFAILISATFGHPVKTPARRTILVWSGSFKPWPGCQTAESLILWSSTLIARRNSYLTFSIQHGEVTRLVCVVPQVVNKNTQVILLRWNVCFHIYWEHSEAGVVHRLWAVSYTHLDVYKRQHISLSKPPLNIKFLCKLLFPSHLAPCSFQCHFYQAHQFPWHTNSSIISIMFCLYLTFIGLP